MKSLSLLLFLPLSALAATVPPLPASEFADTEVSTNLPVVVNLTKRKLDGNWNLVKVTRRGLDEANEFVEIRERSIGFMLMLR